MPESKPRKKPAADARVVSKEPKGNPRWLVPTMVTLFIVGLLWIVTTYLFRAEYPIPQLGNGNLLIGFAMLLGGLILAMRWR